jgi:hypothetical protein
VLMLYHEIKFLNDKNSSCEVGRNGRRRKLGTPFDKKTEENVEIVSKIVRKDRRLNIEMIVEMANMKEETV